MATAANSYAETAGAPPQTTSDGRGDRRPRCRRKVVDWRKKCRRRSRRSSLPTPSSILQRLVICALATTLLHAPSLRAAAAEEGGGVIDVDGGSEDDAVEELQKVAFDAHFDEVERQLRSLAAFDAAEGPGAADLGELSRAEQMRRDYHEFHDTDDGEEDEVEEVQGVYESRSTITSTTTTTTIDEATGETTTTIKTTTTMLGDNPGEVLASSSSSSSSKTFKTPVAADGDDPNLLAAPAARSGATPRRRRRRRKRRAGRPPPRPCVDRDPNCPRLASAGKCSPPGTTAMNPFMDYDRYVTDNCRLSCDACNPSLFPDAISTMKTSTSGLEAMRISPGVVQRSDYAGYPVVDPHRLGQGDRPESIKKAGGGDVGSTHRKVERGSHSEEVRTVPYTSRRIQQVLNGMERYLESVGMTNGTNSASVASIAKERGTKKDPLKVVPELCRNRHEHCALWATKGYCDLKRLSMLGACPAACHACQPKPRFRGASDSGNSADDDDGVRTTLFQRMDLVGIFEAMEEDRVVVPPRAESSVNPDGTISTMMGGDSGSNSNHEKQAKGGMITQMDVSTLPVVPELKNPPYPGSRFVEFDEKKHGQQIFMLPLHGMAVKMHRVTPPPRSPDSVKGFRAMRRWAARGIRTAEEARRDRVREAGREADEKRAQLGAVRGMRQMTEREIGRIATSPAMSGKEQEQEQQEEKKRKDGGAGAARTSMTESGVAIPMVDGGKDPKFTKTKNAIAKKSSMPPVPQEMQDSLNRLMALTGQINDAERELADAERTLDAAKAEAATGVDDGDGGDDYADGPFVVQFDHFLSSEECRELLDLVKGAGRKAAVAATGTGGGNSADGGLPPDHGFISPEYGVGVAPDVDDDGFAGTTYELYKTADGLNSATLRRSSRTYFYPPDAMPTPGHDGNGKQSSTASDMKTKNSKMGEVDNPWRHHPVIEKLLSKLEMITSIPASTHAEIPLLFERYGVGDGQAARANFPPASAEMLSQDADAAHGVKNPQDWCPKTGANLPRGRPMRNARVMGLVLFLNDLEEGAGGEVVFPRVGKLMAHPKAGSAVLIPTVISLVGERPDDAEGGLSSSNDEVLDPDYEGKEWDGSVLYEDTQTVFMHNPVSVGNKYVLTVWLRRYPHE